MPLDKPILVTRDLVESRQDFIDAFGRCAASKHRLNEWLKQPDSTEKTKSQ